MWLSVRNHVAVETWKTDAPLPGVRQTSGRPAALDGAIPLAANGEFTLYQCNHRSTAASLGLKLIRTGAYSKRIFSLGWNGERLACSHDATMLAEEHPAVMRWVLEPIEAFHWKPDLAALKAEMAAAHPDKSESSAAFSRRGRGSSPLAISLTEPAGSDTNHHQPSEDTMTKRKTKHMAFPINEMLQLTFGPDQALPVTTCEQLVLGLVQLLRNDSEVAPSETIALVDAAIDYIVAVDEITGATTPGIEDLTEARAHYRGHGIRR